MSYPQIPDKDKELFLAALRDECNVSRAARETGITPKHAYDLREQDADFAERWAAALKEGVEGLVHKAQKRAFDGVDEPVFYKGVECGAVKKYDTALTMFLLKAYDDRFRERTEVHHSLEIDLARSIVEGRKRSG